jgi:amidase
MSSQKSQSDGKWQSISRRKKEEQERRIPEEWRMNSLPEPHVTSYVDIPRRPDVLLPEELRITEQYDAVALAQAIRQKKFGCVDVARAFCKVSIERDDTTDMQRLTWR